MSQYPQGALERRLSDLESLVAELGNALAEANDADAIAEADDSANFLHRRREFAELVTRAGQLLKQKHP